MKYTRNGFSWLRIDINVLPYYNKNIVAMYEKGDSAMKFEDVDNKFRPIPFWSWNDELSKEETVRQVRLMDEQGIGGVFMHARGGLKTLYMGDEWFENVDACIEECENRGMIPWAYDENGWPSGFGDGKVNGLGIEYQQKCLRCEVGEKHTDTTIANVEGYHFYYEVNPFYTDVLNRKVTDEFIKVAYEPYYERYGNRIEGFFTDEPQMTRIGIPWSFILPSEYEKEYGENLFERLPHLFFETGEYKRTRVKFWRLVTMLFSENFMKPIYEWCTKRNLKLTGHLLMEEDLFSQLTANGACMPHYEYFTMPGMDWLGRHNRNCLTPYQVGSAARQLGKKQVLSESFALCGHNVGHDELKWIYEHHMVRGINILCQHLEGYTNKGLRKRDYPPAMYIQQPWWDDYKLFVDSVSRTGMLLTEGDDGVDTLVIHPQSTAWTMFNSSIIYDENNIPYDSDIMKLHEEFMDIITELERKHINFHLGDEILMERHAIVKGRKLVIGEKEYSKIILPKHDVLFENTEKLLSEFEKNGGVITTVQDLPENDIINVPEIVYCQRRCKNYTMYYFVNGTENTYDALIKKGSKTVDITTGEVREFNGKHTFKKYESLIVIDDSSERCFSEEEKTLIPVDLGGEWNVVKTTDNILTLDYCDYYFDGVLEEQNGYVLNAMYRALERRKQLNIKCEFRFFADYIPSDLCLVCETPEKYSIFVNGKKVDTSDCGFFVDKSFRKINISQYAKPGENIITMVIDFKQSDDVYQNLEKAEMFEAEKNKLTFDVEIEQIYITGSFSVKTEGCFKKLDRNASRYTGSFILSGPEKKISLINIGRQGFPFFAGTMTLKKKFNAEDKNMMLDFEKNGINVVGAKINGIQIPKMMWEPYARDISDYINIGDNEIELTLTNNLRNMQGPFHLEEGESYRVTPGDFYKEKCVWKSKETSWNDDYCFADVSIKNR